MVSSLLYGLAILIVIIGGILLLFKFARHALKWLVIAFGIVLVASAVFGVNLFNDIRDLQENFPKAQKLLLLKDGNTLLAGFEGKLFSSDDVLSYVSKEQLAAFQQYYNVRDLRGIRADYFKVIIFDLSSFEKMDLMIGNLASSEVLTTIRAPDTLAGTVARAIEKENLPDTPETRNFLIKEFKTKGISSNEEMRAFLFVQLFAAALEKDHLFLMNGFKSGGIVVYPETITFKLAKIIPTGVLKGALDKLMNSVNP